MFQVTGYGSITGEGVAMDAGVSILGIMASVFSGAAFLFFVLFYVVFALSLVKISKKLGEIENSWFAWVPFLNLYLLVKLAKKPTWWLVLFFLPVINIVIPVLIWMEIAKFLGKPEWLGVLTVFPVLNVAIPAYFAFSETTENVQRNDIQQQQTVGNMSSQRVNGNGQSNSQQSSVSKVDENSSSK